MSFKLETRPLAAIEILEAFDWYESAKEGLGLEFLKELENFYDGLKNNPKHIHIMKTLSGREG